MKQDRENLYEGMYVIKASLSEEERKNVLETIKQQIIDLGGEIKSEIDMGKKRLAYAIDKQKEGHYFLLYFVAKAQSIKEMWKTYQISTDLLRYVTLRADEVKEKLEFKPLIVEKEAV